MSDNSKQGSVSSWRSSWLTEFSIFLVLWGVCILCILNLNEEKRTIPGWVQECLNGGSSEHDETIRASSDFFSEDSFAFVLKKVQDDARAVTVQKYLRSLPSELGVKATPPKNELVQDGENKPEPTGDAWRLERLMPEFSSKKTEKPLPMSGKDSDAMETDVVSTFQNEGVPEATLPHGDYVIQVRADECIVRKNEILVQVFKDELLNGSVKIRRVYRPGYYKLKAYVAHSEAMESSRFATLLWLVYAGVICGMMIFGFKYSLAFLRNDVAEFPVKTLIVCGICQTLHVLAIWGCGWMMHHFNYGSNFALFAVMPVALGASLCANLLGRRIGICSAILLSALTPVLVGGEWQFQLFIQCVSTSLIGVLVFQKVQFRKQFILGGLFIMLANILLTVFFCIQRDQFYLCTSEFFILLISFTLINVVVVIFGMLIFPPVFELLFDVTTVFTLNELNNRDHILLKRLSNEAPGTFEHSIVVARLASDAAKAAGLNEKLAETCAYFHDIGKLFDPKKFAENLLAGDENPHDSLTPLESCSLLREHIRYGEALAREEHLPGAVREAIVQHHGTGVMKGFYAKACQDAEINGLPNPDIQEFSYTNGQCPIRAEVVLVSIADACEAAVRSVMQHSQTPSATIIRDTVYGIIRDKFASRQFDAAHLTLEKLRLAVDKMVDSLCVIHHVRPVYPSMPAVTEDVNEN